MAQHFCSFPLGHLQTHFFLLMFKSLFIYLERERVQTGDGQGETGSQAGFALSAESPRGLEPTNPEIMT